MDTPAVAELTAEHDAGEHFDDIFMDCPVCVAEWNELTA